MPTSQTSVATIGITLYSSLLVGALAPSIFLLWRDLLSCGIECSCSWRTLCRLPSAAALLSAAAFCRIWWSVMPLLPSSQLSLIVATMADALSNICWYGWVFRTLSVALPSKQAASSPLGIWRKGRQMRRYLRWAVVLSAILIPILALPEVLCASMFRVLHEWPNMDYVCSHVGRVEQVGLGLVSLLVAAALAVLHNRTLELHQQLAAPQGPSSTALLRSMLLSGGLLFARALTLFIAAGVETCSRSSARCQSLDSAGSTVVLVFGYWLPEMSLPSLCLGLTLYASIAFHDFP